MAYVRTSPMLDDDGLGKYFFIIRCKLMVYLYLCPNKKNFAMSLNFEQ